MQSPKKIRLENAHGVISNQQSKKILAKIKKDRPETNIFYKHLALISEISGSPLMVGNQLDLLIDRPNTYAAMLSALENAKDHINMETYIFEDGEVDHQFASLLMAEQKSGVQVNLIYDSAGSFDTPKAFFSMLKDSGINILEFNPINPLNKQKNWDLNQRDHRKLLIVDGKVVFVGGINIVSVYSNGSFSRSPKNLKDSKNSTPWRDTYLQIVGPVVAEFQKVFTETWQQQKGEPLASKQYFPVLMSQGNEVVRAIASNPEESYSQMYATMLLAINNAESQVFLTNAYFVPDPQLLIALKVAVCRGADVKLLLPENTESNLVFYASHSYYDEFLSAHVKIRERQGAMLHVKTALIDGV